MRIAYIIQVPRPADGIAERQNNDGRSKQDRHAGSMFQTRCY